LWQKLELKFALEAGEALLQGRALFFGERAHFGIDGGVSSERARLLQLARGMAIGFRRADDGCELGVLLGELNIDAAAGAAGKLRLDRLKTLDKPGKFGLGNHGRRTLAQR